MKPWIKVCAPCLTFREPHHPLIQGWTRCNGISASSPPSCVNYVGQDGERFATSIWENPTGECEEKEEGKGKKETSPKKKKKKSQFRLQPAFWQKRSVAHHDLPIVKPRRRKDGHHGSRRSNGAAVTNGKSKINHLFLLISYCHTLQLWIIDCFCNFSLE